MDLNQTKDPRRAVKYHGKSLSLCSQRELIQCILELMQLLAAKSTKQARVFLDGQETHDFQLSGDHIDIPPKLKDGWFWRTLAKVPKLRKYCFKKSVITVVYDYLA